MVGLCLQIPTPIVRFYFTTSGGVNYTTLRVRHSIGSAEALGFVFDSGAGIIIKRFTLGTKYMTALPRFRDFNNEPLSVKTFQIVTGIKF